MGIQGCQRKPLRLRLIVVLIVFLVAGNTATGAEGRADWPQPARYTMKKFHRSASGCGTNGRQECGIVRLSYPVLTGGPRALRTVVNARVAEAAFHRLVSDDPAHEPPVPRNDKEVARRIAVQAATLARGARECGCGPWWDHFDIRVVTNMPFSFTISRTHGFSQGSPHPYEYTEYTNYDPVTGREIRLTDIFTPMGLRELEKIAERRFLKQYVAPHERPIDAGYSFYGGRFYAKNFILYRREFALWYDRGEIAAWIVPPTEILIPYRNLRHLMEPRSPLLSFAR